MAIPVFSSSDAHEDLPPPPPAPRPAPERREVEVHAPRQSVPTISVTKPPAPLALDLPTQSDIIPSPTELDSGASSPVDDLESGRHHMMREINDKPLSKVGPPAAAQAPRQLSNEAALIPLPVSPEPTSSPADKQTPTPTASKPLADITDLLADSAPPALDAAAPIAPSSPSSSQPAVSPQAVPESTSDAMVAEENTESQEDAEPETTVRLIGGGGTAGLVGHDAESTLVDEEDDSAEAEAAEEEQSEAAAAEDVPKKGHEKKKSSVSSGLKKITNLGADKRRKDSNASMKDITI